MTTYSVTFDIVDWVFSGNFWVIDRNLIEMTEKD